MTKAERRRRVRAVLEENGVENLTGGIIRDLLDALEGRATVDVDGLPLPTAPTAYLLAALDTALGYHRHYLGAGAMRYGAIVHALIDLAVPRHGQERGFNLERSAIERVGGGLAWTERTVREKYCDRCGWSTVRGVTGELRWRADHDDHAPKETS